MGSTLSRSSAGTTHVKQTGTRQTSAEPVRGHRRLSMSSRRKKVLAAVGTLTTVGKDITDLWTKISTSLTTATGKIQ